MALNEEWGPDDSTGPVLRERPLPQSGVVWRVFPSRGKCSCKFQICPGPAWRRTFLTGPSLASVLSPQWLPPSRSPLVKELNRSWWAVLGHPCCVFCFCLFCTCLVFPSLIRMSPGVTSFAERRAHASGPGPSAQPCFLPQPWGLETHIKQWRQCPVVPAPLPQVQCVSHHRTKVTSTVVRGTGLQ